MRLKLIILIAIGMISFQNIFSQSSSLTVFSEDGQSFYLILNGIRQNEYPETNVRVVDLLSDYYSAKIIFDNDYITPIERKTLMVVDADSRRGETTYKIKKTKKGKIVLRHYSFTPAAEVIAPPASVTVISYHTTPRPDVIVSTQTTHTTTTTVSDDDDFGDENVSLSINIGGISIGANVDINDGYEEETYSSSTSTTTTTTTTSSNNNVGFGQETVYVEELAPCGPMDYSSYNTARESISDIAFSDTQLSQAKNIVSVNCMDVVQLKGIAEIFAFEDDKLEFAKYAYSYCYDQSNYWQMNDVFNFDDSKQKLNSFTQSMR